MANDAKTLVNDALSRYPDSASLVGRALAEITEKEKEENKKEERILDDTAKTREFLITFGEGFVAASKLAVDGLWAFRFGNIELRMERDSIVGNADIQGKEGLFSLASMLSGLKRVTTSSDTVTRYSFTGRVTGRTCEFTLEEQPIRSDEHRLPETILGGGSATKKREGYIVFGDNMQSAQVMEVDEDKWKRPYVIKRVSAAAEATSGT